MSAVFEWPCDRRDAHHPHYPGDERNGTFDPEWCPGVSAHPATMIGGAFDVY